MSADGEKTLRVDMRAEPPLAGRYAVLGRYRFEKDGQSYVLISNEGTTGVVTADAVVFLPAATRRQDACSRLEEFSASDARGRDETSQGTGPAARLGDVRRRRSQIEDARIHVRGSVHTLGAVVPRGFLSVAETAVAAFPQRRKRSSRTGRVARFESESIDRPRVRQPRLALVVRRGARADDRQFRHDRRTPFASRRCSTTSRRASWRKIGRSNGLCVTS